MVVCVLGDDFGGIVVAAVDYTVACMCNILFLGDFREAFVIDELIKQEFEGVILTFYLLINPIFCNGF